MTRKDRDNFDFALEIAALSDCRCRHGAIIAKGKSRLAVGINRSGCHPKGSAWSLHAEVAAILRLRRQIVNRNGSLQGATLYSARVHPHTGEPLISKPCSACQGAILASGIGRVVYWQEGRLREL